MHSVTSRTIVLSRSLSFVPKPKRLLKEHLLTEFDQFVSKLRLKIYTIRDVPMRNQHLGARAPILWVVQTTRPCSLLYRR